MGKDPVAVVASFLGYLAMVKFLPILWKNQTPLKLTEVMRIYNIGQVLLSTYMFVEYVLVMSAQSFDLTCQDADYTSSPLGIRMASIIWVYMLSKLLDFLDTFFFILRGKMNQVSFLHVYHHATTLLMTWLAVKYAAGGNLAWIGMINSFIHIVMYFYYFLAGLGPQYRKYLWWKPI